MSKRDLKNYIAELSKEQLEEQILELYEKFSPVKVYYDFVFKPNEEKLQQESKVKIAQEYFPIQVGRKKRKAKMRLSVGQKYIKHFLILGVDPFIIADVMLYSIEIAQLYAAENSIKTESFYKSMLTSFVQASNFIVFNADQTEFSNRLQLIVTATKDLEWYNSYLFEERIENWH